MSREYPTEGEQIAEALVEIDKTISIRLTDVYDELSSIKDVLKESLKNIGILLNAVVDRMPE